ncbi:MAG: hypothetical protein PHY11_02130 [Bacilli bacterium]|nr:hypothetical protein [Bacilli bacterium]
MNKYDELALLFEAVNGPDINLIRHKIDEVRKSPEYMRLSQLTLSLSNAQSLYEIINKFMALDIYSVKSYQEAIEVEIEVKTLDAKLKEIPSVNPLFAADVFSDYNVSKVGDIETEANGQVVSLNDIANNVNVLSSPRKKALKLKIINWFTEAKSTFKLMNENYHTLYRKIRDIKLQFTSLDIEYALILAGCIIFFVDILISDFQWYRLDPNNWFYNFGALFIMLDTAFMSCVHRYYKKFPERLVRDVKYQLTHYDETLDDLNAFCTSMSDNISEKAQKPSDLNIVVKDLAFYKKHDLTSKQLKDYIYNPKEYFYARHQKLLLAYNICFVVGLVVMTLIIAALEIGFF